MLDEKDCSSYVQDNDRKNYSDENFIYIGDSNELQKDLLVLDSRLKSLKARSIVIGIFIIVLSIFFSAFSLMLIDNTTYPPFFAYVIVAIYILLGIVFSIIQYYLRKIRINEAIDRIKLDIHTEQTLKNDKDDVYSQSIKMSYTYLTRYYAQTQEQASKGFFVTVIIAIFGALIIMFGIISMYFGVTSPAYVTVATGSLTEIISSIFFYLYNKTVTNMSKYHDKLVLSQNVAYALDIVNTLSTANEMDNAKRELMKELVRDINLHLHNSDKAQ